MSEGSVSSKSRLEQWGDLLRGVGIFLTGMAALCATVAAANSDVIKEVLKVQKQAQDIDVAVQKIDGAVNNLRTLITGQAAKDIVEHTDTQQNPQAVIDQIPSDTNNVPRGQVYLPPEYKSDVVNTLSNGNISKQEKIRKIQDSLHVKE